MLTRLPVQRAAPVCAIVMPTHSQVYNPGLRDAIKDYSQWPTIPQLYIKGEFVGMYGSEVLPGCDPFWQDRAKRVRVQGLGLGLGACLGWHDAGCATRMLPGKRC
jgi:hypothetical protein